RARNEASERRRPVPARQRGNATLEPSAARRPGARPPERASEATVIDPRKLGSLSLEELDDLYCQAPLGPRPSASGRGRTLRSLKTRGARRLDVQVIDHVLFGTLPFGIDFDDARWWFIDRRLRVGHFRFSPGPSRWRPTETFRLEYDVSRLP